MKIDYSDDALRRMADAENKLGPIGDGGSVVGGFAQAKRRHDNAIAALHAFSDVFGMIADHIAFAALWKGLFAWVSLGRGASEKRITVRVTWLGINKRDGIGRWRVSLDRDVGEAVDGYQKTVALCALRAAVDAWLGGADDAGMLDAARQAVARQAEAS